MMKDVNLELSIRSNHTLSGFTDVQVSVEHFSLINYFVDTQLLEDAFPLEGLNYIRYKIDGKFKSVISIAPLMNVGMGYPRLLPFKMNYPEINYRFYVTEADTETPAVFFPKMLSGSSADLLTRFLFKMPWYKASFKTDFRYDADNNKYLRYKVVCHSADDNILIDLEDTGGPVSQYYPFDSISEQKLIITHPEHAFSFRVNDHQLSYVTAAHKELQMTAGQPRKIYSKYLEDLKLLSKEEMAKPHSIFICRKVAYAVHTPPQAL